jgi:hypothetical protein
MRCRDRLRYTTGEVGIGTAVPINRLEVKGVFAAPLTSGFDKINKFALTTSQL